MLPTLWQQFGEGPFLFHHDNASVHKARSIQKWFVEISVEELDWPAQSPDLNPIKHIWDELERWLRARPNRPTSVPDLTNALVPEWKQVPAGMFQHIRESCNSCNRGCNSSKGTKSILMPMILERDVLTSRCTHTFSHVVYIIGEDRWEEAKLIFVENKIQENRTRHKVHNSLDTCHQKVYYEKKRYCLLIFEAISCKDLSLWEGG